MNYARSEPPEFVPVRTRRTAMILSGYGKKMAPFSHPEDPDFPGEIALNLSTSEPIIGLFKFYINIYYLCRWLLNSDSFCGCDLHQHLHLDPLFGLVHLSIEHFPVFDLNREKRVQAFDVFPKP